MPVHATTMLDDIGSSSRNIPVGTPYVAGYVTGIGDVPWTPAEFARFAGSRIVRINQGAGNAVGPHDYDVLDVEQYAVTPGGAAQAHKARVDAGIPWTTIYGTDSTIQQVVNDIRALGDNYWIGHVNVWLANWNLNLGEATALLGTEIHGASCIGVQWASPSSNPNTQVPGGYGTLSQDNIDISVVDDTWIPSGGFAGNVPTPPPPTTYTGILVTHDANGAFLARQITSTDDIHWQ